MELDLIDTTINLSAFPPQEIEEVLEDPFSIRLLPDHEILSGESRYYMIGRTVGDRHLFLSFTTDGKKVRIFAVREMSEGERRFYDRRYADYK
jgi:uncharacterized DUF497 family protein